MCITIIIVQCKKYKPASIFETNFVFQKLSGLATEYHQLVYIKMTVTYNVSYRLSSFTYYRHNSFKTNEFTASITKFGPPLLLQIHLLVVFIGDIRARRNEVAQRGLVVYYVWVMEREHQALATWQASKQIHTSNRSHTSSKKEKAMNRVTNDLMKLLSCT